MSPDHGAIRLHSRYNPGKEAARYVEAQKFSCNPLFIVVTEPGESHLASALRVRYPGANLIAIRYDKTLYSESDALWDGVWRPGTGFEISAWLFSVISDEYLPLTVFLPWKPSDSVWPSISSYVWTSIASVIRLQTSVMYTRSAFGKKWLSNCIRNVLLASNLSGGEYTGKPALLAAAGPSLERLFPFERKNFYLCAVSSSLTCLAHHGVKPDLCISTDGGYWALNHFRGMADDVKIAFPLEAAIPSRLLERNPVQFLDYGSAIERLLLDISGYAAEKASRNGTVSGTAALYLMEHTTNNVYAAGLDLCASQSFSHARPNASGQAVEGGLSRTRPVAHSLFEANRDTTPLDMYASWFSTRNDAFKRRFFRIGSEGTALPGIESISLGEINVQQNDMCQNANPDRKPFDTNTPRTRSDRRESVLSWLNTITESLESSDIDVSRDPVMAELLQMVSYVGYIRFLKVRQNPNDLEPIESASREIREEARAFIARITRSIRDLSLT